MARDGFTIGDEIKKNHSFELNPYNLRVHMSSKNRLIVCHFHEILKKYWEKNFKGKSQLNDVFFNKVISELIRTNKSLDYITRGWYLFGIEVAKPSIEQGNIIPSIEDLTRGTGFNKKEIEVNDKKLISIADEFDPNETPFFFGKENSMKILKRRFIFLSWNCKNQ